MILKAQIPKNFPNLSFLGAFTPLKTAFSESYVSQGKTKYSLRGKVSHRHSHNIPIKPYTSPLSFQLQLLIGRGHFSTNFLPIILHENPSIFPASPFLFISLFSSPSSHLTSSATRNYEIQRDPLQLLLCSHFLLPTVKLGIGK